MLYDYFVRITHPYAAIERLVSLWSLRADKLVVYEHIGGKTEKVHCHILILGSNTQKKQLRNIGSEFVDLKGNENCSFKDCISWETPVIYMTKGELDPKFMKGFTEEESVEWKNKWVEPQHYEKSDPRLELYNYVFYPDGDWFYVTEAQKLLPEFFRSLCVRARTRVFKHNKEFWTIKAMNEYKMCVMTFCMRNKVPIPEGTKWKEWL